MTYQALTKHFKVQPLIMGSLFNRLTEEQIKLLDWKMLSTNPAAIDLLEANLDKVSWYNLSQNPGLFYEDIMW